jgi:hypothetical protein
MRTASAAPSARAFLAASPQALLSVAPSRMVRRLRHPFTMLRRLRRQLLITDRHGRHVMNTPIEESAGNCAKHVFTGKDWAKKAWAIATDTVNFADSALGHSQHGLWRTTATKPRVKVSAMSACAGSCGSPSTSDLHSALRRRGTPRARVVLFLRRRRCRKSFVAALHVTLLAILAAHGGQKDALPKRAASPPTPRLASAAPAPADKIGGDGAAHYDAARR